MVILCKMQLAGRINYSYDLRLNHRYFLLEIARSGNARMSRVFADYLNAVGSPLMMNKCGKFYCIPSTNVPGDGMCYRAMRQVYQLLSEGTKKCDRTGADNHKSRLIAVATANRGSI